MEIWKLAFNVVTENLTSGYGHKSVVDNDDKSKRKSVINPNLCSKMHVQTIEVRD